MQLKTVIDLLQTIICDKKAAYFVLKDEAVMHYDILDPTLNSQD